MLIDELVHVSIEPPLRGHGGLIQVVALVAALTGLDEHDGAVEALSVGAGEGHGGGAGAAGGAAAPVPTHTAVVWSVQTSAPAARVRQALRLRGFVSARAFTAFLDRQ